MRATVAVLVLALAGLAPALGGCASWGTVSGLVAHGDRLAVAGDLAGALRAYDDALAQGADGSAGMRARAGRASTAAALAARDEMRQVREELVRREGELERVRAEVQKVTRDLSLRDGELSRAKQDLTARQAELARLAGEAEQLRSSIEDLKRLEIRLERRPR